MISNCADYSPKPFPSPTTILNRTLACIMGQSVLYTCTRMLLRNSHTRNSKNPSIVHYIRVLWASLYIMYT